jgi:DMSO/TMAO reductase YedYZ molybdopterin-dependent catalytic subunit
MQPLSRRQFFQASTTIVGLAFLQPTRLVRGQLFGLFRGKGHETLPITPNSDFYVTSYDLTPTVALDQWSLHIGGMVKAPLTMSFDDILKRPQTKMISTLECIGNTVGGYSIGTAEWEGVKINQLLDEAGFDPKAFDLVLRGADDYSDSFPLSRALEDDVLLATKMNGVPLPPDHGFPARVIVPGIYGMKNVKWLTGLELVNYDYKGYWQQQSWSDTALVKLSSRIDLPGDRELITTPRYTMKGIAFNGRQKIHKVEVSIDAGKTWQEATLQPKLSPHTWTPWNYEWAIPKSGEYTIIARATNEQGLIQALTTKPSSTEVMEIHAITVEAKI